MHAIGRQKELYHNLIFIILFALRSREIINLNFANPAREKQININLWFNPEVQCPKEKEGKGRSGVGEACIVHGARDQAHQQAQNHPHISDHKK